MVITDPMVRLCSIFSDNCDDEGYLGLVLETTRSNLCFPCKMEDPYSKMHYILVTVTHKNTFFLL